VKGVGKKFLTGSRVQNIVSLAPIKNIIGKNGDKKNKLHLQ